MRNVKQLVTTDFLASQSRDCEFTNKIIHILLATNK